MGAYWGNVSGQRIVSGSVAIPLLGLWVADVVVSNALALPSSISLTIGNLTLSGSVYRQATFGGLVEARLVGGGGGWQKSVEARAYNNPGGLLLSTVLGDAAMEVGERVNVQNDNAIGVFYVRFASKASRVLRSLGGPEWYVDTSGVTQVGPRPTSNVASDFTTEHFSGASGLLSIGTEDPASWLPGATFSSPTVTQQTVSSVRHALGADGRARLEIMAQ